MPARGNYAYSLRGGSAPIFIGGMKYCSMHEAEFETGITQPHISNVMRKNGGAPAIIKNQLVVMDFWIKQRIEKNEAQK